MPIEGMQLALSVIGLAMLICGFGLRIERKLDFLIKQLENADAN